MSVIKIYELKSPQLNIIISFNILVQPQGDPAYRETVRARVAGARAYPVRGILWTWPPLAETT